MTNKQSSLTGLVNRLYMDWVDPNELAGLNDQEALDYVTNLFYENFHTYIKKVDPEFGPTFMISVLKDTFKAYRRLFNHLIQANRHQITIIGDLSSFEILTDQVMSDEAEAGYVDYLKRIDYLDDLEHILRDISYGEPKDDDLARYLVTSSRHLMMAELEELLVEEQWEDDDLPDYEVAFMMGIYDQFFDHHYDQILHLAKQVLLDLKK